MLTNFFQLNPSENMRTVRQPCEFISMLRNAAHLKDVIFEPRTLHSEDLGDQRTIFTDKTFENISFSKTDICGIMFNRCTFIDCLFVDTSFTDCEFHGCSYKGCNPHKIELKNTYIDPVLLEDMIDKTDYANIGVYLFQQLYKNAMEMEQRKFARTAEFNLHKWERYILNYKRRHKQIGKAQHRKEWLRNYLFYLFAGYGLQFKFFATWTLVITGILFAMNYFLWYSLGIVRPDNIEQEREIITVLYYTVTTLGRFGDLAPGSGFGRALFLVETFFGLMIVALFLTWLGKQVWR